MADTTGHERVGRSAPRWTAGRRSIGALLACSAILVGCAAHPDAEDTLARAPGGLVPVQAAPRAAAPTVPGGGGAPATAPGTTPTTRTPVTVPGTAPGSPERGDREPGGRPPDGPTPVGAASFRPERTLASLGGCQIFPPEHYLNATGIDRLPTHARSAAWIASLGADDARLSVPTSRVTNGTRSGMPINVVDSRVIGFSRVLINTSWSPHSYRGLYPVPPNPMVQGHPGVWTDQHMIMLDVADCTVYETIGYEPLAFTLFGVHTALNGTRYRLDTVEWPPNTTNAPSTPMVGQYVMRHEVEQGLVPHVLAFCSDRISPSHVWPARRSDGREQHPDAIPMGAWIRLSPRVDLDTFTGEARPVVEALRRHGAVLTDTCGHRFRLLMENSARWNDAELNQLRALVPADFEVVDPSEMIVDPGTWEIR